MAHCLAITIATLVLLTILLQQQVDGATCQCTCCAGTGCTATAQGSFSLDSCTSSNCLSSCQTNYASTCNAMTGSATGSCSSAANKLTFYNLNAFIYSVTGIIIMMKIIA